MIYNILLKHILGGNNKKLLLRKSYFPYFKGCCECLKFDIHKIKELKKVFNLFYSLLNLVKDYNF